MKLEYGDISNIILLTTTVIAWITLKKYKITPLKYLPYYLTYAAILEIGADIMSRSRLTNVTVWWYNIGINIEILFYLYIFYQYIENKKTKRLLLYFGVLYESYFLINYLFFSDSLLLTYQAYPFVFGGIVIIITVFIFLLEMFQSDKVLHVGKYLIFWISIGLLFYNIIPLPSFALRKLIPDLEYSIVMRIQYTSNIIMYLLFIYGFLWSSMKYKS